MSFGSEYHARFENLSYAIGYYRKRRGLSQEQLAEHVGQRQGRPLIIEVNYDRYQSYPHES